MNNIKKTKPNFTTTMKNFTAETTASKQDWFMINFCQLGFIGKLFSIKDLPTLIRFFLMFYSDKPVDWLLYDIMSTKVCKPGDRYPAKGKTINKGCEKEINKIRIEYKPSLFQHIGRQSSLIGKIQNMTDNSFGKIKNR